MLPLILCILFMVAGAICLTLFLLEKVRKYSVKATMIKSLTSLCFIGTCAVGLYQTGKHVLSLYVIFGLLLGLLGDIWLDFKYVFPHHNDAFTYAGFTMFGVGHILYIGGMFHEFYHGENILYIIIPLIVGLVISIGNVLLEKVMKLNYGQFKWIVFVYGFLLFSMVAVAMSFSIIYQFKNTTLIMIFAGGIFFALSDLILSGTYFGVGKERPVDIISNAITYYLAQYTIAFSMFFLV